MKKAVASLALATSIACASAARADEAPVVAEPESPALQALADHEADHRHAQTVLGVATGAVLIPTGIMLAARPSDQVGNTLGTGLLVSGSAALMIGLLELRESHIERMADANVSPSMFADEARKAKKQRLVLGTVETTIGVLSTAFGIGMLVAHEGALGLDRTRQYRMGAISTGAGVPFMGLGIRTLMTPSAEETLASMGSLKPVIAPTATRGGAGVSLSLTF